MNSEIKCRGERFPVKEPQLARIGVRGTEVDVDVNPFEIVLELAEAVFVSARAVV